MTEIRTSDFDIEIKIDNHTVAHFDGMNGIEGDICEGDNVRMAGSDLIRLAQWFLEMAAERARDEEDRP
jgi:hypothetical protein